MGKTNVINQFLGVKMPPDLIVVGKLQALTMGMSLSKYIRQLIHRDTSGKSISGMEDKVVIKYQYQWFAKKSEYQPKELTKHFNLFKQNLQKALQKKKLPEIVISSIINKLVE